MLSGHTDVVPVDGQDWSSDPFAAEVRGDKLYGRGTCDHEGASSARPCRWSPKSRRRNSSAPIHFALSFDEEVGCAGVPALLTDLAEVKIKPALAIVGEPTLMKVVGAHKGGTAVKTRSKGTRAIRARRTRAPAR